ncbi:hypothetical protein DFP72DRAFT_543616 [Ephemerocybe angulata]|uniref:Uncharacterized protein n=1 Tax=Ephemerocybe angulata TaxID=980116 RepID=A0A8H6HNW8_9AGAR|nr:hypothetical protein DFP72DRAFT_543616 [Tulosesus angulatus]
MMGMDFMCAFVRCSALGPSLSAPGPSLFYLWFISPQRSMGVGRTVRPTAFLHVIILTRSSRALPCGLARVGPAGWLHWREMLGGAVCSVSRPFGLLIDSMVKRVCRVWVSFGSPFSYSSLITIDRKLHASG